MRVEVTRIVEGSEDTLNEVIIAGISKSLPETCPCSQIRRIKTSIAFEFIPIF